MRSDRQWSNLIPHPAAPPSGDISIRAAVDATQSSTISLAYEVRHSADNIVWPGRSAMEFRDELWKTTCFELFIALTGRDDYVEFNFSPSAHWAAYRFKSYRGEMTRLIDVEISKFQSLDHDGAHSLEVELEMPDGLIGADQTELRAGLTAVIADKRSHLSYWALSHPLPRPDFHHELGFTKTITLRKDAQ